MVNYKTRYFVHRGIKTLQFMFGRKILHFERHNLLNKRSEIFGKCRHKNRFRFRRKYSALLKNTLQYAV
jgi:hypothetical protein